MDVLAGEVVGIFAHVERADEHGAGGFQPLDQGQIPLRRRQFAIDLGAGAGRQAGDVEQVLHGEGDAGQRAERVTGRASRVEGRGALSCARGGDVGEGVEQRIELFDARQRRLGDGDGGHLAARHGARNVERRRLRIDHIARVSRLQRSNPIVVIARLDRAIQ